MFLMAVSSCSFRVLFSSATQARLVPNLLDISSIFPSTISGLSTKYLLYVSPLSSVPSFTHSSSSFTSRSLFLRKIISLVTSVPASPLKVLLGSLIAPKNSALSEIYLLISSLFLSIVPLELIKATTPPERTLSKVLAKKKS